MDLVLVAVVEVEREEVVDSPRGGRVDVLPRDGSKASSSSWKVAGSLDGGKFSSKTSEREARDL